MYVDNYKWLFISKSYYVGSGHPTYITELVYPLQGDFVQNCGQVGLAVTTVPNLSYLNGMTVAILADGFVLDQQVVSGGTVTLPATYTTVQIGLPYVCQLQPVNAEVQLPDGTMQGRQVNITKCMLKVWNSAGGYIGPNFESMQPIYGLQRSVLINTNGVPIYTGDVPVVRGGGYQGSGSVCIQQTDPLPITITGIVMELQPGKMINLVN